MAQVATFNQVVGSETIRIAIPVTRIDKLMDRVDTLIENGNTFKARQILTPFIINEKPARKAKQKKVKVMATGKGVKKEAALELIAKLQKYGVDRSKMIAQLSHDLDMSYANARHYVVNVAKIAA
jgi:hypothetical protein